MFYKVEFPVSIPLYPVALVLSSKVQSSMVCCVVNPGEDNGIRNMECKLHKRGYKSRGSAGITFLPLS